MIPDPKIFIGYDSTEPVAAAVLMHSILTRASAPLSLVPLTRKGVMGAYTRPRTATESTEFSFTRFLVPYLSRYDGWSVFMDCDMLCQVDLWELVPHILDQKDKAVLVCQHDYVPKGSRESRACGLTGELDPQGYPYLQHSECDECRRLMHLGVYASDAPMKMDGKVQTVYPRKNWSSFMVFQNAMCRTLTREYVRTASGADLHQFAWVKDSEIGTLPLTFNWLVGEYEPNRSAEVLHFTLGSPFMKGYENCDHADLWNRERDHMLGASVSVDVKFGDLLSTLPVVPA